MVHWESMPPKWASSETFINRFYNEAELSNRCVSQKLDKVAGSARGNLILPHFKTNSRTEAEYGVIMDVLHRPEFTIATPFVKDALEEGPVYMIEIKDGEEVKVPAERWTEHHTRLLFVSIPGFKENERRERGEHEDWYFYLLEAMQNDPYNRAALWFLDKNYEAELEQKENDRQRASLAMMKGLNAEESGLENEVVTEIRPQPNDFGYREFFISLYQDYRKTYNRRTPIIEGQS
uniref:Uncharacterized protein n=2 Tax=Caenorhabditis japonica TaxID=281687 RepID=A0A8R1IKN3_CAEJA